MTGVPHRKPQVFAADDPALCSEIDAWDDAAASAAETAPAPHEAARAVRPTLAEFGARGLRWGKVLLAAMAGAVLLGLGASLARVLSAALVREDWVGWSAVALLAIAVFAALMLALGEAVGFLRLARLNRLRVDADRAVATGDRARERAVALRLARLYASRSEFAWAASRFRDHGRDVHDPGELLLLAEREMLTPLDSAARRLVTRSAKRVATVTALSPMVAIAVTYVALENLRMLRALAALYGGRPGLVGLLRLANMVLAHLLATGGVALTDDLLGQFLGQDVLRRLSRRLGEGAFNGALTARIGIAALAVIRPLPFRTAKPPRARAVLSEVLNPLLGRKPA